MNSNGLKLGKGGEASEYQKRIDRIDTVILCMAEVEKMIGELGKDLLSDSRESVQPTITTRDSKRPAWEGMTCPWIQKRRYP
ncbi:MAG: hypothetical protein QG577_522 [Thermodesulfobacteriota bacterium]|nr:hypothetical protein [Thermodesulfobacteriota bacterium]